MLIIKTKLLPNILFELEKIEQIVFPLYETEDPALIYKKMQDWYALIDQEDPVFD